MDIQDIADYLDDRAAERRGFSPAHGRYLENRQSDEADRMSCVARFLETVAKNRGGLIVAVEELDQEADYWWSRAASSERGFPEDAEMARQCERGAAILRAAEKLYE